MRCCELEDAKGALQSLDSFADDTQMPSDLRAEALLHKSMIMRDMKRTSTGEVGRKPRDRSLRIAKAKGGNEKDH